MLVLLLATALSLWSLWFSLRAYARCRRLTKELDGDLDASAEDELERRLAERGQRLELGLAVRSVSAVGRAALFGGTGAAVWALTGGASHYLQAGVAFGVGLVGWMGSGELSRRIGSLAGSAKGARRRCAADRGVDRPSGTG